MTDKKQNWPKALANAINLATSVAMAFAVGLLGGQWLDEKFNTAPWLMLIGLIFAALTSGKMMWERLMDDNRSDATYQKKDKEENP
ncbi:MAG: AtpZ/AtpI family protein [Bacillota bacterium]|nr:AtpZ/AtpI family protein [Bacillota bacterium]